MLLDYLLLSENMYLTWECAPPFEYCNFQKKGNSPWTFHYKATPLKIYSKQFAFKKYKIQFQFTSTEGDPI